MASFGAAAKLLTGRVAIVTGASSGLGRAMALAFTQQGASVVCADRSPRPSTTDRLSTHEMIEQQGGHARYIETDVADELSVQALVAEAASQYGRLDIMVNNAGIAPEAKNPKPVWEISPTDFDAVYRVNVRGVFLGCKYGGAQMLKQEKLPGSSKSGSIINMGSILGVLGKSGTASYAATKGAVIAMTRAMAMDFVPHQIHCNSILPGFTRTPMIAAVTDNVEIEQGMAQAHPLGRLGEPDEIANAAVFLASDLSKGITGLNMSVDGGLHSRLSM
ncbi:hypothetical protein LTR56_015273 [Elasticomyces elasticus]|nr:hypothetical protein LTR56_015273 [Elasticomyces elasticus]KAK3640371.1 hypothetical protein LTR22_017028 [Elasticomyces elasticus]KAK4913621.1 hypothetical protein LTR49_018035 [Elasticomyces elasticus]KAK5753048.1 hypothetical protein LTS12_016828 [Elasticomyces elasticus]